MIQRIRALPSLIANQIAAGEVIERPASVIKELLENSMDAGADSISIEIGYGGLNLMKVSDNGFGIVAEDLPLAVAAHATSKITKLDDLYAIESMGFRGEALASIASISKLSISSRTAQQQHAMKLEVKADAKMTLSPCARTIGTTIDVVDLFFNAPVRKRFLKNEKLEFQAIESMVKRFALSAPHIAFTLKHNDKVVFSLPAAVNEQAKQTRMSKIFGSAFLKDAIYIEVEHGTMRLCGWLSGPHFQRSQNDRQWVYINQRMVKDRLIYHALKQSYDGLLYPGRFPACLLYFTIPTAEVDVNVHPTKHEVRFQQPRLVHDFFTSQLTKVLQPEVDIQPAKSLITEVMEHQGCYEYGSSLKTFETDLLVVEKKGEDNSKLPLSSYRKSVPLLAIEKPWVILNPQYIIVFIEKKACIVDIIALQQQYLTSQLEQSPLPLASRPLLVPIRFPMALEWQENIEKWRQCVEPLGIHMDWSQKELYIRSIPIRVPYLNLSLFLAALAKLESFQIKSLFQVLSQSQSLDLEFFSIEERMELNHYLQEEQKKECALQGIYKILSEEDYRVLLRV